MNDDQLNFFVAEKPCPDSIVNCSHLREEFFKELEEYKKQGACSSCAERSLRNKYLTFIMASTPTT
jgi:hypothetical protein